MKVQGENEAEKDSGRKKSKWTLAGGEEKKKDNVKGG